MPHIQVFDVLADEAERHNLASEQPELVKALMAVVERYNRTAYVEALGHRTPVEHTCPHNVNGVLTPC